MNPRAPALLLSVAAAACVDPSAPEGPPFRAQVLVLDSFDDESETVEYAVAERELTRVTDFDRLESPLFRIARGGSLTIRDVAGSVVADGEFSGARDPGLRYAVEGGVAIPRDYATLTMVSSYYHFERVLDSLERVVGVSAEELVAETGSFEALFEPVISVKSDVDVVVTQKLNAFYLPRTHQFGLARRSSLETVPLAANPMVLSHEFGHALFEYTFHGGVTPECDPEAEEANLEDPQFSGRFSYEYAMSGLNEGFADFIAFGVTGATNVLAGSGIIDSGDRSLTKTEFTFDSLEDCDGAFYCVGTLFSRSLYRTYVTTGRDAGDPDERGEFSRQVVAAMKSTRDTMRARAELPAPEADVARCQRNEALRPEYDGQVTGAFLAAFSENLDEELRGPLCAEFVASFGESGFPAEMRDPCGESQ